MVASADRADLVHEDFVDREAAGGVEHDDVEAFAPPGLHRAVRDLDRGLARNDGQAGDARALGELGELQLRGRALGIEAGEQDAAALLGAEHEADLAGGGGFAGALEPDHEDGDRRRDVQVERHRTFAAEALD